MEENRTAPHVLSGWGIEVNDNFMGAEITFSALGSPGNPDTGAGYSLPPVWLSIQRVEALQKELTGLLAYMRKGVEGSSTRN